MSRAVGEVWVDGELKGYFVYNGTVDLICSRIYLDFDEFMEIGLGRRSTTDEETPVLFRDCTCNPKTETPAILYTNYGDGWYWLGTVCLKCMAITSELLYLAIDESYEVSGHPFRKNEDNE
jgi:hypothetical protein